MSSNNQNNDNPIRILYYGAGWPSNIGNAFIDLGAMAVLRSAVPNSQIAFASEMPRWFFGPGIQKSQPKRFRRLRLWKSAEQARKPSTMDHALDMASVTQCDIVVFSGMAMCEEFIKVAGPSVLELTTLGVGVLLLGTGALTYSRDERMLFGDFLQKVNPIGFVSRDDQSYEMFESFASQAHKGIDCAFFVQEAYSPFPLLLPPYIVSTFDSMPEPELILNGRKLIRAHHDCLGPSLMNYTNTESTLISDIPYDYLALYSNAEEVHSDRVHACITALAYGRKARLYHPTPRGSLFDAVGSTGIRDELVQLDMPSLAKKKEKQVQFTREAITKWMQK